MSPIAARLIQHLQTVAAETDRPIMIYNNPVAYRVDITPEMFVELADNARFVAIKESSEDVRRITEIKRLTGDRFTLFVGVDNLAMESLLMGAQGWVAGLVCAFPRESVALYHLIMAGRLHEARDLYRWFVPLLALDTGPKFVHYIKLAQAMTGLGTESLRAPRLALIGEERTRVEAHHRRCSCNASHSSDHSNTPETLHMKPHNNFVNGALG